MKYCVLPLFFLTIAYGLERPTASEIKQLDDQVDSLKAPVIKGASSTPAVPFQPVAQVAPTSVDKVPWLGVLGEPISQTLKLHLGLQDGLVLRQIAQSSPAHQAGLESHDIIKSINGTPISTQESLKQIIYGMQPGDTVQVLIHRKGSDQEFTIELGGKEPNLGSFKSQHQRHTDFFEQFFEQADNFFAPPTSPLGKSNLFGGMFEKLLQQSAPNNHYDVDFQSTGSVQMMDQNGSVEIKTANNEKYVIVRNLKGEIEYEGDWSDEQSKLQAPEKIRNRIENIDFNYQNQSLHLSSKIRGISGK